MSLNYGLCLGETEREYTSAEFSDAMHALFGDGICQYGERFGLTVGGFDLNVTAGYAVAAGRYVKNNNKFTVTLGQSSNRKDRCDALAVRVDYAARRAALEVVEDVEPEAVRQNPVILRNENEYCVILYFIRVRRGATTLSPGDVEDVREDGSLCGRIVPLAEASKNVLYIYRYLTEGIDEKAAHLMSETERILQKGDNAIAYIDALLEDKGITPVIGELRTAVDWPLPYDEWLLCDGGEVDPDFKTLTALIGSHTPVIVNMDTRLKTFIYAGKAELQSSPADIPSSTLWNDLMKTISGY